MIKKLNLFSRRSVLALGLSGLLAAVLTGCGKDSSDDGEIFVVATTSMVGEMVREIGGPDVEVKQLMGPGIDPHSFDPVLKDTTAMDRADIVFYSGLMLEGTMERNWEKHSAKSHAVASRIPADKIHGDADHPDAHVWGDAKLWATCVDVVVDAFVEFDPDGADGYRERGEAYRQKLLETHEWALKRAKDLPEDKRVMVTSHDAFKYFGEAYGFEVYALQGISTATSSGAKDRADLAQIINDRGVKTIFHESAVSDDPIRSVAEDANVAVSETELFADAMGVRGEMETVNGESYDVGTYDGMIKHNMNALIEELK